MCHPFKTRLATGLLLVGVFSLWIALLNTAMAASGGQPFVIHETYAQGKPVSNSRASHGIVGLDLLIQQGHYPRVSGVFRGTPAATQGLLPGDMILAINGVTTMGKSMAQVDAMISDIPGEQVLLMIQRGERLTQVKLTVAPMEELPPSLRSEFSSLFGTSP